LAVPKKCGLARIIGSALPSAWSQPRPQGFHLIQNGDRRNPGQFSDRHFVAEVGMVMVSFPGRITPRVHAATLCPAIALFSVNFSHFH